MSSNGIRSAVALFTIVVSTTSAHAQLDRWTNLQRLNSHLVGHISDYTSNHGSDRRIFSPILGMRRDLYVYLPPGYSTHTAYSLVLCFHIASSDERIFLGSKFIEELDQMIGCGEVPPLVVAFPDGTYPAWDQLHSQHSFYINGLAGRFQDYILQELLPFLTSTYTIRPERQARGLVGFSAGGYGAMALAIEHHQLFGAVATLAAPLNLRYSNADNVYFEDFNPTTYRWKTSYNPHEIIGVFGGGLIRMPAQKFMEPVFGQGSDVVSKITRTNPADLILGTDLRPGELAIYVNYPGRDNFNFDAQAESFLWFAEQRVIPVTALRDPEGTHDGVYFRRNQRALLLWLGQHLLPPAAP